MHAIWYRLPVLYCWCGLRDSAYFEDLAGRLYGLAIRFSDQLPADQAQWLHHVVEMGEYGLALEDLAAMSPTTRSSSLTRSVAT
jgi:hypothetical protein